MYLYNYIHYYCIILPPLMPHHNTNDLIKLQSQSGGNNLFRAIWKINAAQ